MSAVAVPVVMFVILRTVLVYSNKIAGPLYRLEKELDQILETNDFSVRIHFRKGDQLNSVADKINMLLDKMEPLAAGANIEPVPVNKD